MDLNAYFCNWKFRNRPRRAGYEFTWLLCGCLWDVAGGHKATLCDRHAGRYKKTYRGLLSKLIYRMSWDVCDLMNGKLLKRLFAEKRRPPPDSEEVIVPLSVLFEVDGRRLAEQLVPHLPNAVKRFIPEGPRKEPQ